MKWITESISVGGLEDAINVRALTGSGISGVLSIDWFPAVPASNDLLWRKRTLVDGPGNSPDQLGEALDHLTFLLENCDRVLVHCREGMSRSPFVVACHLALSEDRPLDDVVTDMLARNPIAIDPALFELWQAYSASKISSTP